jgi:hypothetical protein
MPRCSLRSRLVRGAGDVLAVPFGEGIRRRAAGRVISPVGEPAL